MTSSQIMRYFKDDGYTIKGRDALMHKFFTAHFSQRKVYISIDVQDKTYTIYSFDHLDAVGEYNTAREALRALYLLTIKEKLGI